jgi:hypothetical protein
MTRSVGNGKNKSRVRRPSIPRPVQQEGDSEEVVIKVDDSEQGSVQQDEDVDGLAAPAEAQVQGSPQRPEKVRTPSNAKTAPYLKVSRHSLFRTISFLLTFNRQSQTSESVTTSMTRPRNRAQLVPTRPTKTLALIPLPITIYDSNILF